MMPVVAVKWQMSGDGVMEAGWRRGNNNYWSEGMSVPPYAAALSLYCSVNLWLPSALEITVRVGTFTT
jgi:hypothetical protein